MKNSSFFVDERALNRIYIVYTQVLSNLYDVVKAVAQNCTLRENKRLSIKFLVRFDNN